MTADDRLGGDRRSLALEHAARLSVAIEFGAPEPEGTLAFPTGIPLGAPHRFGRPVQ
jgi:hypothetical protein